MFENTDTHDSTDAQPTADAETSDLESTATDGSRGQPATRLATVDAVLMRIADGVASYSYRWVQASFAGVFLYFGLQKWPIVQGASPVRPPVSAFVEAVGFGGWIPFSPEVGLLAIGVYEVTLGTLWLATIFEETLLGRSRVFVVTALMTAAHQFVAFLPLVVVPTVAFRQTQLWLPLVGTIPFGLALDWLAAFILKNVLFVGAFLYAYVEWAERYGLTMTTQE